METFLKTLPVAHRGLHGGAIPENSLSAFCAAAEAGYAIETDVRFSRDRALVVFHDDGLSRMTGDPRPVSDCDERELKALRLDGTDERIPAFSDLLGLVRGRVPLLIELKNMPGVGGEEIAAALLRDMERADYRGEFAVQSFQPMYVKAFKKLRPDVPAGVLGSAAVTKEDFGSSPFWRWKAAAVRDLLLNPMIKPDFVSYRVEDLPRKCVARFGGIRLGWVVSSKAQEEAARQFVDNIIFEGYRPKI